MTLDRAPWTASLSNLGQGNCAPDVPISNLYDNIEAFRDH
jgi:hypothetical protein